MLDALQQLGATWGEAALLTTGGSAVQGPWAAVAQSLAQADGLLTGFCCGASRHPVLLINLD